jgi:hypothetical protein
LKCLAGLQIGEDTFMERAHHAQERLGFEVLAGCSGSTSASGEVSQHPLILWLRLRATRADGYAIPVRTRTSGPGCQLGPEVGIGHLLAVRTYQEVPNCSVLLAVGQRVQPPAFRLRRAHQLSAVAGGNRRGDEGPPVSSPRADRPHQPGELW